MKILIVRLSALGDIVHALPVLAAIKKAKPDAQVDWLVEENYAAILALASGLNRRVIVRAKTGRETPEAIAFTGGGGYLRAARYLRAQQYDVALDLQGLLKSAVWARVSGARRVVGFDRAHLREELAASFYSESVVPDGSGHVMRKNLSILSALQIAPPAADLRLQPVATPEMVKAIQTAGGSNGYIVINPGAAWPNKCWPPDRFGVVANALRDRTGLHSLVTWGPQERALAEAVSQSSGGAATPAPPTSVSDLAALMQIRRARDFRRHRAPAHRGRGRHADRRLVRSNASGAQRAMGAEGRSDLALRDLRVPSQAAVSARCAVHQRDHRRRGD